MGLDMRIKRKIWVICAAVLTVGALNACGRRENVDEDKIFQVNYISNDEVKVVTQEYTMQADLTDPQEQVEELLSVLGTVPERLEYKPAGECAVMFCACWGCEKVCAFKPCYQISRAGAVNLRHENFLEAFCVRHCRNLFSLCRVRYSAQLSFR